MLSILLNLGILLLANLLIFGPMITAYKRSRIKLGLAGTNDVINNHGPATALLVLILALMTFEATVVYPYVKFAVGTFKFAAQNSIYPDFNSGPDQSDLLFAKTKLEGKDIIIEAGTIRNPNYKITFSGYPVANYNISSIPKCEEMLCRISKNISEFMSSVKDPSIRIGITIVGQADAIPCKANAVFGDSKKILNLHCYSNLTGATMVRNYIPGATKMRNEDYGVLRAFGVYSYLYSNIHYANKKIDLASDVSDQVGAAERKVMVRIVIKNGLNKNSNELNSLQKKFYNMMLKRV